MYAYMNVSACACVLCMLVRAYVRACVYDYRCLRWRSCTCIRACVGTWMCACMRLRTQVYSLYMAVRILLQLFRPIKASGQYTPPMWSIAYDYIGRLREYSCECVRVHKIHI